MLYEEQIRTGIDHGIYYSVTKKLHPKFKHFTPLNLERYVRDWEMEHGVYRQDEREEVLAQQVEVKSSNGAGKKSNGKKNGASRQGNQQKGKSATKKGAGDCDAFEEFERSK